MSDNINKIKQTMLSKLNNLKIKRSKILADFTRKAESKKIDQIRNSIDKN